MLRIVNECQFLNDLHTMMTERENEKERLTEEAKNLSF
jgi:hypothetical protein